MSYLIAKIAVVVVCALTAIICLAVAAIAIVAHLAAIDHAVIASKLYEFIVRLYLFRFERSRLSG